MMYSLNVSAFTLFILPLLVWGQASSSDTISHGMDMNMDTGMTLASGQMLPYLHFSGSDILWFRGWVPQNKGAIGGACIGLFMLGLFDRWFGTLRSAAEVYWKEEAQIGFANNLNARDKTAPNQIISYVVLRTIPPFIPANDFTRGLLYGGQALLGYAFMLIAMTFNAAFILSITVGLGVGEMFFGRYS